LSSGCCNQSAGINSGTSLIWVLIAVALIPPLPNQGPDQAASRVDLAVVDSMLFGIPD
jgi:hypothetical protein